MAVNREHLLILGTPAAVSVSCLFAWRSYFRVANSLSGWRRQLLRFALVTDTVLLIVYLVDLVDWQFILWSGPPYRSPGWTSSGVVIGVALLLSITAGLGGAFGRGTARVLTILNSVVLFALWWMVALATSP